MVTVGMIGVGRIGKIHLENMSRMKDIRVKAISDLQLESITSWAKDQRIERMTTDYQEILRDDEIDIVCICSPTKTHASLIREAALYGKHIFCEKPISLTMKETEDALKVVKERGVQLQIGFNRRFDSNFKKAHEIVRSGKLGDVHIVKITSRDPEPPSSEYVKMSGGIFIDMSIHDFDMARYIVGSEVTEVYAQGSVLIDATYKEIGDVDTAVITLKFENGSIAVIDNSRKAVYGYDQRLEVFGEKGCITVENALPTTTKVLTAEAGLLDNPKYFFLERYKEAYQEEICSFIHAIRHQQAPIVTGNDGYQAERIAHAAKISLMQKRPFMLKKAVCCNR